MNQDQEVIQDQQNTNSKKEIPIRKKKDINPLDEGMAFNKWLDNRFKNNKNVLIAITGATGSGKTYTGLKILELWYQYRFERNFAELAETHICFSIREIMTLLSSGRLRKGSILLYEEAGTSLNSLDYQTKISKLFTFILQSFRNMNVGLIFTLPVLTMLNKSARLLLHGHFITQTINPYLQIVTIKPLFHQLNQEKGKSYWKYMRIGYKGEVISLERFNYSLPSQEIIKIYEDKKKKFVYGLANDFVKQLDEMDREKQRKLDKNLLSDTQQEVFEDVVENGLTPSQCAIKRERSKGRTYDILREIKSKGFSIEKWIRYRETKSKKKVEKEIEKINKKIEEKKRKSLVNAPF